MSKTERNRLLREIRTTSLDVQKYLTAIERTDAVPSAHYLRLALDRITSLGSLLREELGS